MTVRVALVGLPGVGKSTVGAALADALGVGFVDVDDEVCEMTGHSAAELLRTLGEGPFRDAESAALERALSRKGPVVVATGGGAVTREDARRSLRGFGTVIHLVAPSDVVAVRMRGGDRPLAAEPSVERVQEIERARGPWYAEVATATVEATGEVDEVVARILEVVGAP